MDPGGGCVTFCLLIWSKNNKLLLFNWMVVRFLRNSFFFFIVFLLYVKKFHIFRQFPDHIVIWIFNKTETSFPSSSYMIKGELHSNYIFLHFVLLGLEWNSITLFTKMNFVFFQNSHFNTICTRYRYGLLFTNMDMF